MKQQAFVEALKFASHAMATKDMRYYLNGVLFEFRSTGLTLVGTDGHRMAYVEMLGEHGILGGDADIIVPAATVKLLLTAFKASSTANMIFAYAPLPAPEGNARIRHRLEVMGANAQTIHCEGVDGKFPDWRRVCKAEDKPNAVEQIAVNSDYLAAASKACGALSDKYSAARLTFYGNTGAIKATPGKVMNEGITFAAVVVMPMRD